MQQLKRQPHRLVAVLVTVDSSIVDNDDGTTTITLVWHGPLWSVNADCVDHRMKRAKRTKDMRAVFAQLAAGCPPLEWCDLTVRHFAATKRKRDTGMIYTCAKAALDGVVDAGVLADDNDTIVHDVLMQRAVVTPGQDSLALILRGPAVQS